MHTIRALVAAAAVGTSVAGALAAPAGAAERPVARYHLEHAWPAFEADQASNESGQRHRGQRLERCVPVHGTTSGARASSTQRFRSPRLANGIPEVRMRHCDQ